MTLSERLQKVEAILKIDFKILLIVYLAALLCLYLLFHFFMDTDLMAVSGLFIASGLIIFTLATFNRLNNMAREVFAGSSFAVEWVDVEKLVVILKAGKFEPEIILEADRPTNQGVLDRKGELLGIAQRLLDIQNQSQEEKPRITKVVLEKSTGSSGVCARVDFDMKNSKILIIAVFSQDYTISRLLVENTTGSRSYTSEAMEIPVSIETHEFILSFLDLLAGYDVSALDTREQKRMARLKLLKYSIDQAFAEKDFSSRETNSDVG